MSTARSVQRSKPCVLLLQWRERCWPTVGPSVIRACACEAQIREALAATRRSPFTVFTQELPLT